LYCPKCGAPASDRSQFCSNCGTPFSQGTSPNAVTADASNVAVPYPGTPQTSGKAIGSLICGIINIFPLFIVAVILGHLALSDIKKSAGRLTGRGLAIAGLVLGYLGVAFIPFILIIAAIAIPNLLRARLAANEASAAAGVRYMVAAEVNYSQANAALGYTCNLSDLRGELDPALASGVKHGYRFQLQGCAQETEGGPITKFQVRAFCTDETGVVRVDTGGSAEACLANGSPLE
jgi:hypothetical protein